MTYKKKSPKVAIVMGSQSDYLTMKLCQKVLKKLKFHMVHLPLQANNYR